MARGTQLGELVTQLRSEMKLSDSAAHSVNRLASMKLKLRQVQERLWLEYDWPFMIGNYEKTLAAGSRYYDLPVDPGRINSVHVKWQEHWLPLNFGIGTEQYNQFSADETTRLDPATHWDFYNDSGEQFEVWPVPATNGSIVRFDGVGNLSNLVSETDTADLDDMLIVLYAAAALMRDPADRQVKALEADAHFKRLKKRYRPKIKSFSLGKPASRVHGRLPRILTARRTSS